MQWYSAGASVVISIVSASPLACRSGFVQSEEGTSTVDTGPDPSGPEKGFDGIHDATDDGVDIADPPDPGEAGISEEASTPCGAKPGGSLPPWVAAEDTSFVATCGDLKLSVSAPRDRVFRLRYSGDISSPEGPSHALLPPGAGVKLSHGQTGGDFIACLPSGASVKLSPTGCSVEVRDALGTPVIGEPLGGGYFEDPSKGIAGVRRLTPPGEHFYGLGNRTGPLDRRGRVLTSWNNDAYDSALGGFPADADPLYLNVPFFIGLRPEGSVYGVYTDNTRRMRFDMAASDPGAYEVAAWGGEIDQYVMVSGSFPEVMRDYTALTGRAPLPPRWSLGFHQSRWGYESAQAVLDVAKGFRDRGIPADAIWLDIQHLQGNRSWTWDPVAFPDPPGLVMDLADMRFAVVSIADPGILVEPGWDVYDSGMAKSVFIHDPSGQPFVASQWAGPSVWPDFTSQAARDWWASLVPRETGHGVRGLWIDMNEPTTLDPDHTLPDDLPVQGDGKPTTMATAHNIYALLEARATFDGMYEAAPGQRPFILTRAGFAGTQRYAAAWTGDAVSGWPTLAGTLPTLLGLGLSGIPFVGSDVGGYSGDTTPELYARWIELGSVSPFFRAHVTIGKEGHEPWAFDDPEVEAVSRAAILGRYELLPYLYSLFRETAESGSPILRPLVFDFPSDEATHAISDQAMLGPWLLVAPVMAKGASDREACLPAGRWFEFLSGAVVEGPKQASTKVKLAALPAWVREGAIIPHAPAVMWTGQAAPAVLLLDVYPADHETRFVLYEDDGHTLEHEKGGYSRVEYSLKRAQDGAVLEASPREGSFAPPARPLIVRVRRVDKGASSVTLDGNPLAQASTYEDALAAGGSWWYDAADLALVAVMDDGAGWSMKFVYDPQLGAPSPPVPVTFEVSVPPGTPANTPIHIASSVNGWTHTPLSWTDKPLTARGTLAVPRGEWFEYKFTRGSWATVEKWSGCVEATNRYGFGAAHPVRQDQVATWADLCGK